MPIQLFDEFLNEASLSGVFQSMAGILDLLFDSLRTVHIKESKVMVALDDVYKDRDMLTRGMGITVKDLANCKKHMRALSDVIFELRTQNFALFNTFNSLLGEISRYNKLGDQAKTLLK